MFVYVCSLLGVGGGEEGCVVVMTIGHVCIGWRLIVAAGNKMDGVVHVSYPNASTHYILSSIYGAGSA